MRRVLIVSALVIALTAGIVYASRGSLALFVMRRAVETNLRSTLLDGLADGLRGSRRADAGKARARFVQ